MERRHRLRSPNDFKRVRRTGSSYAHPLVVLIASPNGLANTRLGVAAGKSVGGAVERNRAKRHLREALRPLLPALAPGWDLIWIARPGIAQADQPALSRAIQVLLRRSGALRGSEREG